MRTGSDSEPIIQLYEKLGNDFVAELNGIFGIVLTSNDGKNIIAARDHCGIKPLYIGYGQNGELWFASELKCIVDQDCKSIEEFPAGHYWTPESGFVKYYDPQWKQPDYSPVNDAEGIKEALDEAVRAQCMSDVPFGLLLSGGLDSAVVAVLLKPIFEE